MNRRNARAAVAIASIAIALPVVAQQWARARTSALASKLSEIAQLPIAIESIEVGLSGELRLEGVRMGDALALDAIEAAVDPMAVFSGPLRVAQVSVDRPRLQLQVAADGSSSLGRALARLSAHRRGRSESTRAPASGARKALRIVVGRGSLTARLGSATELSAKGVALHPQAGGVRVTTGEVTVSVAGALPAQAVFPRAAADIDLASGKVVRALAPAGTARVAGQAATVSASLGLGDGATLRAQLGRGWIEVASDGSALSLRFADLPLSFVASLAPPALDLKRALASGSLSVAGDRRFSAELALQRISVSHENVASEPVELSGQLHAEGELEKDQIGHRLRVTRASLSTGGAELAAAGWWRAGSPPSFEAELRIERSPCQTVLEAVPLPLRRRLLGLQLGGELSAQLLIGFEDGQAHLAPQFEIGCQVLADGPLVAPEQLAKAFTLETGERSIPVRAPSDRAFARLPRHVAGAFVAAEDAGFYGHDGFDMRQIERSLAANLESGRVVRGGSTISQQLVKNVFLDSSRTLGRKLEEVVATWRVEATTSKARILDVYLQIIELGPGVRGIDEAARYWFDRSPRELEPVQAAFLAALTRAPSTESARIRSAGKAPAELRERVDAILHSMRHAKYIDRAELANALAAPLALHHTGEPALATELASRLRTR